jgi:multimeric flavodoxin WrbA
MDASSKVWATQDWQDKVAAGFTHSASQGGVAK